MEELRLISLSSEHSKDNLDQMTTTKANNSSSFQYQEITKTLSQYPWYHGLLSRNDSTNMVLHKQARHILSGKFCARIWKKQQIALGVLMIKVYASEITISRKISNILGKSSQISWKIS